MKRVRKSAESKSILKEKYFKRLKEVDEIMKNDGYFKFPRERMGSACFTSFGGQKNTIHLVSKEPQIIVLDNAKNKGTQKYMIHFQKPGPRALIKKIKIIFDKCTTMKKPDEWHTPEFKENELPGGEIVLDMEKGTDDFEYGFGVIFGKLKKYRQIFSVIINLEEGGLVGEVPVKLHLFAKKNNRVENSKNEREKEVFLDTFVLRKYCQPSGKRELFHISERERELFERNLKMEKEGFELIKKRKLLKTSGEFFERTNIFKDDIVFDPKNLIETEDKKVVSPNPNIIINSDIQVLGFPQEWWWDTPPPTKEEFSYSIQKENEEYDSTFDTDLDNFFQYNGNQ